MTYCWAARTSAPGRCPLSPGLGSPRARWGPPRPRFGARARVVVRGDGSADGGARVAAAAVSTRTHRAEGLQGGAWERGRPGAPGDDVAHHARAAPEARGAQRGHRCDARGGVAAPAGPHAHREPRAHVQAPEDPLPAEQRHLQAREPAPAEGARVPEHGHQQRPGDREPPALRVAREARPHAQLRAQAGPALAAQPPSEPRPQGALPRRQPLRRLGALQVRARVGPPPAPKRAGGRRCAPRPR